MGNFIPDDYVPVHVRLQQFWADNPSGRITTELIFLSEDFKNVVIKANAYRHGAAADEPAATGIASEVNGEGYVNKTSFIENAETSAVGRALANMGYEVKDGIASREEMQKVQRMQQPPFNQQAATPAVHQAGVAPQAAPASPSVQAQGIAASEGQIRMMYAIANGANLNLPLLTLADYQVEPEQLTKAQAMEFIDKLKVMSASGGTPSQSTTTGEPGATQPQLAAVAKIAAAAGLAVTTLIEQEFPEVSSPDQLSKAQASHLIKIYGAKKD